MTDTEQLHSWAHDIEQQFEAVKKQRDKLRDENERMAEQLNDVTSRIATLQLERDQAVVEHARWESLFVSVMKGRKGPPPCKRAKPDTVQPPTTASTTPGASFSSQRFRPTGTSQTKVELA